MPPKRIAKRRSPPEDALPKSKKVKDPRNQAVRAVASRCVPGARSCQGACGLCSPDQKARPGGCLPRVPSAQPQQSWQPWPHPRGEGLDAIGCPGRWRPRPSLARQMAKHRTLIGAYLFANVCAVSYSSFSSSAACLLPTRSGDGDSFPFHPLVPEG